MTFWNRAGILESAKEISFSVMGRAEESHRTLAGHARGVANSDYEKLPSVYGLPAEEKGNSAFPKEWCEAHPHTRPTTRDPWRWAKEVCTTCGTICTQAVTGLVINRYQPSRDMQTRWLEQDMGKVLNGTTLKQCQEVGIWSDHVWGLLWDDVRPEALWHTIVR